MALATAHPRVSGENAELADVADASVGSSPRERGKPTSLLEYIVPDAAHPRVSGENYTLAADGATAPGSSPRERGKLQAGPLAVPDPGLIPA